MAHGGGGVAFLVGDFVGGAEDAEVARKTQEQLAVRDEVVGVGETVALDVGRVGIFGIWPPIIAFGGKVVEAAGAAGVARGDEGLGLDADGCFSGDYEPRALGGGEVKLGQSKEGEEGEHGDRVKRGSVRQTAPGASASGLLSLSTRAVQSRWSTGRPASTR